MPGTTIPYKILMVVSVLLFIAVAPLPYGYYTFLRIIVCGCSSLIAYQNFILNREDKWIWIFSFIAILFNPVAAIHITKEIWLAIDVMTGIFFAALSYKSYCYQKEKEHE